MSEKNTIVCSMSDHIGQMTMQDADEEIHKLKAESKGEYVKDISPYLEEYDDTKDMGTGVLTLGNCWVVKKHVALNIIQ